MADRLTPVEIAAQLEIPNLTLAERRSRFDRASAALAGGRFKELWKYTPAGDFVAGLGRTGAARPELRGADGPGVLVRGLEAALTDHPGLSQTDSADRFPLADLALLITGDALVIDVTAATQAPLEIDYTDGISLPVFLNVASGASATLIERCSSERFGNQSLYVNLGEGARLDHTTIAFNGGACHWALAQVNQHAGSRYVRQQYFLGGSRRRTETQVLLSGVDAEAEIAGAYVVDTGTHLDQQLVVEHRAPSTKSRQRFHGIGAGKGTAVFNGRIHIHPGAPGTDAALTNRNLALHPDATINTKPELEIYTDDVRCSHGATVGQVSEESLFYLRSRGLGPIEARRMLCRAFIRECIEGPLAETVEAALLGSLPEAG